MPVPPRDDRRSPPDNQHMHVLLVGVGTYADERIDDLEGPYNDVVMLYRTCVHHLGVPPKNITVMLDHGASIAPFFDRPRRRPLRRRLRRQEPACRVLQSSRLGQGATVEEIKGELTRLASELSSSPHAVGWFHFSGHGVQFTPDQDPDHNLAICGGDKHGGRQDIDDATVGTLALGTIAHLEGMVGEGGLADPIARITMTFDCCWNLPVGASLPPFSTLGSLFSAGLTQLQWTLPTLFRALVGTTPGQDSREVQLQGVEYGAFSWALATAMSRWALKPYPEEGGADAVYYLTGSYTRLLDTVKELMGTLRMLEQRADLIGPRVLDHVPVFHPRLEWTGHQSLEPDVVDGRRQLWSEDALAYRIEDASGTPLIVVDLSSPGKERWTVVGGGSAAINMAAAGGTPAVKVVKVPIPPPGQSPPNLPSTWDHEINTVANYTPQSGSPPPGYRFSTDLSGDPGSLVVHQNGGVLIIGLDRHGSAGSYTWKVKSVQWYTNSVTTHQVSGAEHTYVAGALIDNTDWTFGGTVSPTALLGFFNAG